MDVPGTPDPPAPPTPSSQTDWGDTVRLRMPVPHHVVRSLEAAAVCDDAAAVSDLIVTVDPDVLKELLDRQDDFPKMWNRGNQATLFWGGCGGGGGGGGGGGEWLRGGGVGLRTSHPPSTTTQPQTILADFTGEGLFTSSTTSEAWCV